MRVIRIFPSMLRSCPRMIKIPLLIVSEEEKRPDRIVLQKIDQDFVRRSLSDLTQRERTIIELYYGLQDEEPRTLKEIGEVFGITRERVRQIKEHAINKLRQSLHVQN